MEISSKRIQEFLAGIVAKRRAFVPISLHNTKTELPSTEQHLFDRTTTQKPPEMRIVICNITLQVSTKQNNF